jgi:hypothetical protein
MSRVGKSAFASSPNAEAFNVSFRTEPKTADLEFACKLRSPTTARISEVTPQTSSPMMEPSPEFRDRAPDWPADRKIDWHGIGMRSECWRYVRSFAAIRNQSSYLTDRQPDNEVEMS